VTTRADKNGLWGKFKRALVFFLKKARNYVAARKNYKIFMESGKQAIDGDLASDIESVHEQFVKFGLPPVDYSVDVDAFARFITRHESNYASYRGIYGDGFVEKSLEHYISTDFMKLYKTSRVMDIANAGSPFPAIVHEEFGCDVWCNDLEFSEGMRRHGWLTEVGGNAGSIDVPDNYFELATMHCALEMFEGSHDTDVVRRAERMLKPGGKLVVLPLYMSERYHILRDVRTFREPLPEIDAGAELIYRNNFYGIGFARFYNVAAFVDRLVKNTKAFDVKIYRVRNAGLVDSKIYLNWIAVFEKKAVVNSDR